MRILTSLIVLLACSSTYAHPTGNIVHTGEYLVWSYVCPVGSVEHRACLMTWSETTGVKAWLTSEYTGSDWMISSADDGSLFLVERYYDAGIDKHRFRVLKAIPPGCEVAGLASWEEDDNRFGEGGFVALPDGSFLFARYPNINIQRPGQQTETWAAWKKQAPVYRITKAGRDRIVVLSEDRAWLVDFSGNVVQEWSDLLDPSLEDLPFLGNTIFDLAHGDSGLWLAYWGARRLDVLSEGKRQTAIDFEKPFLPHAVTVNGETAYVLASSLDPGSELGIVPLLYRVKAGSEKLVWSSPDDAPTNSAGESTAGCSAILE